MTSTAKPTVQAAETPAGNGWRAVSIVLVGAFMALLDTTIVNVALPTIRSGLHASPASLEWVVSGYALAYGGIVQLLAGMWEFRRGNVFASTAFSSYGGFWIGLFVWIRVAPAATGHDLGWILLAFAIFNTYMLLMATQVNAAVFGVFLFLELTEIFLAVGNFSSSVGLSQVGGYLGLVTALVAWYTSAAGVSAGMGGRIQLPVGRPLIS